MPGNDANTTPNNYYKSGSKSIDFIIGFLGIIILLFALATSGAIFFNGITGLLILLLVMLFLIVLFFKIGRKFIAIGIISVLIVGLLLFGSCLMMLSNANF